MRARSNDTRCVRALVVEAWCTIEPDTWVGLRAGIVVGSDTQYAELVGECLCCGICALGVNAQGERDGLGEVVCGE